MLKKLDGFVLARSGMQQAGATGLLVLAALMAPAAQAQSQAAMRVAVDPLTGELRAPTAEENQVLDAQAAASAGRSLSSLSLPGGGVNAIRIMTTSGATGYDVGDAFLSLAVVTRNADGSLTMQCVTGTEAAEKIVNGTAVANEKEHAHAHE